MCECYQIGGPWVGTDPNCPAHGEDAVRRREEEEDRQIRDEATIAQLRSDVEALTKKVDTLQECLLEMAKEFDKFVDK